MKMVGGPGNVMRIMKTSFWLVACTISYWLGYTAELRAERLDVQTCLALKTEKAALIEGGTKEHMSKGAEWAKANLAEEALNNIKRYITITEKLNFRCHFVKPKVTANINNKSLSSIPLPIRKPQFRGSTAPTKATNLPTKSQSVAATKAVQKPKDSKEKTNKKPRSIQASTFAKPSSELKVEGFSPD